METKTKQASRALKALESHMGQSITKEDLNGAVLHFLVDLHFLAHSENLRLDVLRSEAYDLYDTEKGKNE